MDIEAEIRNLSERLERIEGHLGIINTKVPPKDIESPIAPQRNIQQKEPIKSPQFSSAQLLGTVSIVCLILACAFIIKLAIDSGWLSPIRQIGIASVIGGSLIALGFVFKEKDPEYASYLPAAGIVTLFLSIFGAHIFYGMLDNTSASLLAGVVSFLAIWLFTEFRSDIFPICAAAGSYCVPVITGFLWRDFESVSIYFISWSVTYAILSIYIKSRTLTIISSYFGIGIYGVLCLGYVSSGNTSVALIQLLQFLILFAGTVGYSILNREPLSKTEAFAFYPILIFFYATEYEILNAAFNGIAPYIMIALAALLFGGYWAASQRIEGVKSSRGLVESFCLLTLFHSVYLELLPQNARPVLYIIILICLVLQDAKNKTQINSVTALITLTIIFFVEYGRIISKLTDHYRDSFTSIWIIYGVCASSLLIYKGIKVKKENPTSSSIMYLVLGHFLFVATLFSIFEPIGSLPLSIAWTMYACSVLYYGFVTRDESLAKSSLVVLFFAVGKVFTYDVANASSVIRILCLFLTGIVLYGCGWLLRKIERWKGEPH